MVSERRSMWRWLRATGVGLSLLVVVSCGSTTEPNEVSSEVLTAELTTEPLTGETPDVEAGVDLDEEQLAIDPAAVDQVADEQTLESWDGLWVLVSGVVDGYALSPGGFLEIDGQHVAGDVLCNRGGGEFGGEFGGEQAGCIDPNDPSLDLNGVTERIFAALSNGPEWNGDNLVFAIDGVQLVYHSTVNESAEDLFSILDDPAQTGDRDDIVLDPEAGGTPRFQKLARLEHSSMAASFFIAKQSDLVCLIISTEATGMMACLPPRQIAGSTYAYELNTREGPTGIIAALIPDDFVEVASLSELGAAQGNLLVVDPAVEVGEYAVINDAGEELVVIVQ